MTLLHCAFVKAAPKVHMELKLCSIDQTSQLSLNRALTIDGCGQRIDSFYVQMVCRLIQQQHVRCLHG